MTGTGSAPRVVVLAGGVGGSKLVAGLARMIAPDQLTIVVNTGDDFVHLGLSICPDLDTVMHRLVGVHDPDRGWGRADETWTVMDGVAALGGPDWFRLGDRDLATHLVRTHALQSGRTLTQVTHDLGAAHGLTHRLHPMTDDPVRTHLRTDDGWVAFQDWFVARRAEPTVQEIAYRGASEATADPTVVAAIAAADVVVLAPSNPFLSIDPIRAVPALGVALRDRVPARPTVAVSPIVGGRALRGPAANLLADHHLPVSAVGVAHHLRDVVTDLVVDDVDHDLLPELTALGLRGHVAATVMDGPAAEDGLAAAVLDIGGAT